MTEGLALFDTALGRCGIAWSDRGVAGVQLPEASDDATVARLRRRPFGTGLLLRLGHARYYRVRSLEQKAQLERRSVQKRDHLDHLQGGDRQQGPECDRLPRALAGARRTDERTALESAG